jgi:2,4-dichlorophenol 6-monooxygenase
MALLDKEFHAHGAENGFSYPAGALVPDHDATGLPRDMLVYHPTSAPGHHLPHTWLRTPDGVRSTLDLPTPGRFALLVGDGADVWRAALASCASPLAGLVDVVEVGTRPDAPIHDESGRWSELREVGPGGAILVRPDTIVAWRAAAPPDNPTAELDDVLTTVVGVSERPRLHRSRL